MFSEIEYGVWIHEKQVYIIMRYPYFLKYGFIFISYGVLSVGIRIRECLILIALYCVACSLTLYHSYEMFYNIKSILYDKRSIWRMTRM